MLRKYIWILGILLLVVESADAQRVLWRIGGVVQVGAVFHNADFKALPGDTLPDNAKPFAGTTGISYGAGIVGELPLWPWFAVGGQVDIQGMPAVLTTEEGPFPYASGDSIGEIFLRHTISHSLLTIGIQPTVVFTPGESWVLRIGWRFGVPVSSSFEQTEEIIDASAGLEYLIGGTIRSRDSATSQPEVSSLENEVEAGIGINIPLHGSLVLRPMLSYRAGFTDKVVGLSWKTGTLQLSASLFRQFTREREIRIDTVYRRDTTVQLVAGIAEDAVHLADRSVQTEETVTDDAVLRTVIISEQYNKTVLRPAPLLTAGLDVRFVLKDGRETEGVRVSVETVLERNVVPILPYIFFDHMSAELPSRYHAVSPAEVSSFIPEQLDRKDVLGVYRNLLNIIGLRLQKRPEAKLLLTGANSGEGEERRNTDLSQRRAEAVRRYLGEVWGITAERIGVRAVNLPSHPSNTSLSGGSEENRRVELASDDPSILAPVFLQDTVRAANPPIIRFYPRITSEAGIADWQLTIHQGERFSKVFADNSEPPDYIDWNIEQDKAALISADAPMNYTLRVRDLEEGTVETEPGSIVFQVRRQGRETIDGRGEITRYSLIVFDYDGADVTRFHRSALATIQQTLPSNADIAVIGMTDVLGDEEYNRQLSERRARVIASALQLPPSVARGIGEQSDLSSETPEGRFYSRRVDILVSRNGMP